jgi:hypothetical protein
MKMAAFWVVLIALMMEAARTSETLVNFYQTTRCYNPENNHFQIVRYLEKIVRYLDQIVRYLYQIVRYLDQIVRYMNQIRAP